jgi:hypothetical protein
VWYDVLFFACYEMGISPADFWELEWDEYERRVWFYRLKLARKQEPFRDLQAQLHNMLAEKSDRVKPHELMWLLTDRFAGRPTKQAALTEQQAHWARMKAAGLL